MTAMLVSSLIVRVDPRRADEVSRQLGRIPSVKTYGVHKKSNIVIVAEARDEAQLENLARFVGRFDDVLGVYPAFIASDEDPSELEHERTGS